MEALWVVVPVVTALSSCLVAGALFAFSGFVMRALADLAPASGIGAMQSINRRAVAPPFMAAFLGTAVGCVALVVMAILDRGLPHSAYAVVGSVTYLVGVIGLTGGFHVPRNDALAAVQPDSPDGAERWRRYVTEWTRWNHVRVAAGVVAAALFIAAAQAAP